jgi:thiosulfate reductase cytochrome b subunit
VKSPNNADQVMTNYIVAMLCALLGGSMLGSKDSGKFLIAWIFLAFSLGFVLIQFFDTGRKEPATHEQIAALAKQKWEQASQPEGRDEEFWLAAERELNG